MKTRRVEPACCRSYIDHGWMTLAAGPSVDVSDRRDGLSPLNQPPVFTGVSVIQYTEKVFIS